MPAPYAASISCSRTNTTSGRPMNAARISNSSAVSVIGAPPQEIVDKVTALREVADAHGIPLGAAALQFALAHPVVCSVLTGPKSPAELDGILAWWNTPIPAGFWRDLADRKLVADG